MMMSSVGQWVWSRKWKYTLWTFGGVHPYYPASPILSRFWSNLKFGVFFFFFLANFNLHFLPTTISLFFLYEKCPMRSPFLFGWQQKVLLSVNGARSHFLQAQSLSLSIAVTVGMQGEIVAQNASSTTREKNKGLVPVYRGQIIVVCCHCILKVNKNQQDETRKLTATVAQFRRYQTARCGSCCSGSWLQQCSPTRSWWVFLFNR